MKACTSSLGLLALLLAPLGCSPSGSFKVTSVPSDQSLKETVVYRQPGWVSDKIAVIDISGVLMNSRSSSLFSEGEHVVSFAVEKLERAARDAKVKAVVLRINSPGGTVTASDTLHAELVSFKKRTGKPVVAFFQDVAASGAYYLACAADQIMAQRTSVTGSIGVIMQMVDLSGTMARIGISSDAIKSGPNKDAGSPFRPMKKEERALFQAMVDGFYGQFVEVVDAGRPNLTREQVLTLADGRVYTADQALEGGLVDAIGTIHDAVSVARGLAKVEKAHVVLYHRPLGWKPNVYAQGPQRGGTSYNLINLDLPFDWTARPRFMYIWDFRN